MTIEMHKTAILAMDYQSDILGNVVGENLHLVSSAQKFLTDMRNLHAMIIYVRVGFRDHYPEIAESNIMFKAIKHNQRLLLSSSGSQIVSEIQPQSDDVIIDKRRVNAFYNTDLEIVLRAKHITTLVMFGVSTGGVVLSTLRDAADRDYQCIVIKDLCADPNKEVHNCLVEKIFPRQSTVIDSQNFNSTL